ncbi:hypothetical protein CKN94_11605 [Carnobacterium maltaromaticum]|nr:hypothetical protein CKN94_11605 [Carnobacterium maltaromaticum]TFJ76750.1 hypothetical protein CKN97_11595 [Carnobacterium maltaromaticum]
MPAPRKKDEFPILHSSLSELNKIFSELTGLNKLFYKASSYEPTPREKDKNSRWQKAPYQFFLFSYRSYPAQRAFYYKEESDFVDLFYHFNCVNFSSISYLFI